ncbi:MAG: hypothetical protein K6C68_05050 [Ruminococcus sp.]|nr:hypothetical protein [Ruminococcus sp.]
MSRIKKTVMIAVILLVMVLCLMSLRSAKPKTDEADNDKGRYSYYTESNVDSEGDDMYFYGK